MMKFILWDRRDGDRPSFDYDTDQFISDGIIGRITEDNVYLTTYADYPDGKRPKDLKVGERISGVRYTLSGGKGHYDIWRVE